MRADSPQLEYGLRPRHNPKLVRRLIILLLVIGGVGASVRVLIREYERIKLIRLYERVARFRSSGLVYAEGGFQTGQPLDSWLQINAALSANIQSKATIFVGELRTASGRTLLVGVDVIGSTSSPVTLSTRAHAVERGRHVRHAAVSDQTISFPSYDRSLIIELGVPDPDDPSHFNLTFRADDQYGIIDGWLRDDGTVIIEARADVPTTAPAPPLPARSD